MKRNLVQRLAGGLAGVVFLAQMMVAAYACPAMSTAIAAGERMASVISTTGGSVAAAPQVEPGGVPSAAATAAPMTDCNDMLGSMDPFSANLCAEHCKYGQQSDHAPTLTVPVAIFNALYTTPTVPLAPPPRSAAALMGVLAAAFPPHAILHCVFRI